MAGSDKNACSESDKTDQKCQIMLLRIIRVEGDLFIIHNILMRHLHSLGLTDVFYGMTIAVPRILVIPIKFMPSNSGGNKMLADILAEMGV